jgi:hypothetical protein
MRARTLHPFQNVRQPAGGLRPYASPDDRCSRMRVDGVSRREFVQSAGAVMMGTALAQKIVQAHDRGEPRPIPGGTPLLGGSFHVFAPGPVEAGFDGLDADPSTITDFNGVSGLAYVSGTVRRKNLLTHEVVDLPFVSSDMRFMQGVYRDADERVRHGTFALV